MENYKEYNNKLFSRWAPIYDGFELVLSSIRNKITEEINPVNKSILDVATGTGSLAIALSNKADKVVGIDLSTKMLNVANKKNKKDNLSFKQMDASNMSFDDHQFDIVTISLGLHDMPLEIRTLVLKEVKRVVKKEGKVYVFEHQMPENDVIGWCTSKLLDIFESRYFLPFIKSDFNQYLQALDFKIEKKAEYGFGHFQLLTLIC